MRDIDQQNRIESLEINPHIHTPLTFAKGSESKNGEKIISSTNSVGETRCPDTN